MYINRYVPLSEYTTFRIGGRADFFCSVASLQDLEEAVRFAKEGGYQILILGGGSNVLFSDSGYRGLVIHVAFSGTQWREEAGGLIYLNAAAGENWDRMVEDTVRRGFHGLENLSCIPGSVGASVVQNIGAYGAEVKDVLDSVEVFDTETMEVKTFTKNDCQLAYRDSVFKKPEGKTYIVMNVTYRLEKNGLLSTSYPDVAKYFNEHGEIVPTLASVRDAIVSIRKNKLPNVKELGTAGSFFKNPIVSREMYDNLRAKYPEIPGFVTENGAIKIPAGWLIDKIGGWRGFRNGGVGVYEKQALVLVNYGGARATDVVELAEKIEKSIEEKTKIILEREVCVL